MNTTTLPITTGHFWIGQLSIWVLVAISLLTDSRTVAVTASVIAVALGAVLFAWSFANWRRNRNGRQP